MMGNNGAMMLGQFADTEGHVIGVISRAS
jgi:hypothetical protein